MHRSRSMTYVALAVLSLFVAQIVVILVRHGAYFWDFDVYYAAASALGSGENPYAATAPGNPFQYVYPLVSLVCYLPLVVFGPVGAPIVHFGIQLLVLAGLWRHWNKNYVDSSKAALFSIFFMLAFNSCISSGFRAGNAAIFEAALVWAAIAFYLRGRLIPFTMLIVLSACFKIVTIAYLGLLIFRSGNRKWAFLAGGTAAYALVFGFVFVAFPQWHHQMVENITLLGDASRGSLNPALREFFEDVAELGGVPNLYLPAIALISALTAWRIFSIRDQELLVMLYVIAFCLVLPRMKDYSYTVLILPVYYTFERINYSVLRWGMLIAAMVPTRYITRYLFGISDDQALRSIPFLAWEYLPLLLLFVAWTYHVTILSKQPAA